MGIVKELGVFDLPFLFANEKEADAVLDGPAGQYFNKKLEEAGLVNLAYWENGFRNLTNSKRPIAKVEDFDGVKVRVMQNNIFLDTFKTLGTNAVPMAFGEVFTALETKTIDGQENPFVTIETSKFNEVQKYLSVTRHAYTPFLVLYSKKLWDQLSPQEQAVLREAAIEGQKVQRAANRSLNEKSLASLKAKGMVVNDVTPAEQRRMFAKVKPVYDKNVPTIGAEAVNVVLDALKKARGGKQRSSRTALTAAGDDRREDHSTGNRPPRRVSQHPLGAPAHRRGPGRAGRDLHGRPGRRGLSA